MSAVSSKPRILFVNRSYWPDTEATGQLLTALCEGLTKDFDVHVLAGKPNATTGSVSWQNVSSHNGVNIHRVSHTTFSKRSMLLKGLNFLSFAAACRRQITRLPAPDIVVFETDPFLLPFVADRLHKKTGCHMVGYLQDIYPDVAIALKKVKNRWWVRLLRRKLFDVYQRCSRMVVLSTDMQALLVQSGIAEDKTQIIPNWADPDVICPVEKPDNVFLSRHSLHDKFVVMYSGNLGLTQRLEAFVDAAHILKDDRDIVFVFVGRGARRAELQKQAESLNLSSVLFFDYQPMNELSHSLGAADLHLIPLTEELSRCLMPSKLYGVLAAGRAFLTNAPAGSELHSLTVSMDIGITVEAGSPEAIATAIRSVKNDPERLRLLGNNGRDVAESHFTRKRSTEAFAELLKNVNSQRARA